MFKNILVPIDLAHDSSREALDYAIPIAKSSGGRMILLNIQVPVPPMVAQYLPEDHVSTADNEAAQILSDILTEKGIADIASAKVRHGSVYHEVLGEAEDSKADLIVIASHHPELSDYLLGSNAASIVRHADCSVLVLRT